jgi:uncharacterized protein YggU (UPF0235/DUF167 family)
MNIKVRVTSGAKNESLTAVSPAVFEVSVRERAIENQANDRVRALIAMYFKVPTKQVRIIHGHHRPSKMIQILSHATPLITSECIK